MGRNGQILRVSVIGTGYLGLTHAVCMADLGHEVLAIDVDADKIAMAARGETPFFEPGLEPLLRKNLDAGRLRFTDSFAEIGEFGDVHFICVGTPQVKGGGGSADLSYVFSAAEALAPHLNRATLVVGKSTVPVGTSREIIARVHAAAPAGDLVDYAFNPEFLREGYAVQDSLTPDRIVFGVTSDAADELMRAVYATPLASGIPGLTMDLETAELVKVAANSFLATKISFINVMAEMCEASGADVIKLADAIGIDERIGRKFLSPGLGFGGGCLPKDIRAFRATAGERGVGSLVDLLTTVDAINLGRRTRVINLARQAVGQVRCWTLPALALGARSLRVWKRGRGALRHRTLGAGIGMTPGNAQLGLFPALEQRLLGRGELETGFQIGKLCGLARIAIGAHLFHSGGKLFRRCAAGRRIRPRRIGRAVLCHRRQSADGAHLAVGEDIFAIHLGRIHGCLAAIGGGTHADHPLRNEESPTLAVFSVALEA